MGLTVPRPPDSLELTATASEEAERFAIEAVEFTLESSR